MQLSPNTTIANRYEIIERIGSGGMAIVYRAKDTKLDRFVTFKVMREEFVTDEEFIARFNVEARAAACLSNQNIVNVYDVVQDGMINYIVMEYIDGVTLKDLIKRRNHFDNDETLGVAIQIATALEHAHKNNIIHRDIKPQNILVTTSGVVKVTDFGIARAATSGTLTAANNTMGSVHYFSPEQARGVYIDNKSDIYSLGIVMYEMITGELPFDGDTAIAIALKHINDKIPDIREKNPDCSDSIVNIILKATEKQASKRYQTITEMCNDLKRALTNSSGDFVKSGSFIDSPTIKLTEEDIVEIQRESRLKEEKASRAFRAQPRDYEALEDDNYEDIYDGDFEDDEDENKSAERKVIIAAVITSLVIISVILYFGYNFLFGDSKASSKTFLVPNLIGTELLATEEIALSGNINIVEISKEYNDEYEAGIIIEQSIIGEVKKGDTVNVVTSLGSDKSEMPDFTKKDINAVHDMMKELEFQFSLDEEYIFDNNIAQNVVIRQEPEAGEMVKDDVEIKLYISQGQQLKTVSVPNIVGVSDTAAIRRIQDAGLVVGKSSKQASVSTPEGLVASQSIVAGTEVAIGSIVSYVISLGPPKITPEPTVEPEATEQPVTTDSLESATPVATAKPPNNTRPLTITLPLVPEGATSIHMLVLKVTSEGTVIVMDKEFEIKELPYEFLVTVDGPTEFQLYSVDSSGERKYISSTRYDVTNND